MTITRRDFLKLSALLTASSVLRPGLELLPTRLPAKPDAKNVLIILFDTLPAKNINFNKYPRETMPNLTRLLDRVTVKISHFKSRKFSLSGTAALHSGQQEGASYPKA